MIKTYLEGKISWVAPQLKKGTVKQNARKVVNSLVQTPKSALAIESATPMENAIILELSWLKINCCCLWPMGFLASELEKS